jgi:hypothetical protein
LGHAAPFVIQHGFDVFFEFFPEVVGIWQRLGKTIGTEERVGFPGDIEFDRNKIVPQGDDGEPQEKA